MRAFGGQTSRTATRRGGRSLPAAALCLLLAGLFAAAAPATAGDDYDPTVGAWPLFRLWSQPEQERTRLELLWPLIEWYSGPEASGFFFRPLYNRRNDKASQVIESDILWPLGTGTHRPDLFRITFDQLFLYDHMTFSEGEPRTRWALLPLFYYQAGRGPTNLMLFPLFGLIRRDIIPDDLFFLLWPLFVRQENDQRRIWSMPHPIIAYVKWNDGGRGFKVWPLFGWNRRPENRLDKLFILWPIYQHEYRSTEAGEFRRWFIFPFYGEIDDPRGGTRTILWPFFAKHWDDNINRTDWWYPWPFFGHRTGPNWSGFSIWPLFTRDETDGRTYGNFLWPIGWYRRDRREGREESSFRIVPLFFRDWKGAPEERRGAWQVWPLIKYRYGADGEAHVELPSVWPYSYHAEFERNLGPFFRLFQYDRSADGHASWRFLWRLVRVDSGPEDRYAELLPVFRIHRRKGECSAVHWQLFKGLLGYRRRAEDSCWQFLYFLKVGDDLEGDATE